MIISVRVSWNTYYALNTTLWNTWLVNSCQWEDRSMEKDNYAEDARIKEQFQKDTVSGKLREQYQTKEAMPLASSCDTAPTQTIEQERTIYTRKLYATIADNEASIRALKVVLNMLERKQKNAYILAESLQRNDANQAELVRELRKHVDG